MLDTVGRRLNIASFKIDEIGYDAEFVIKTRMIGACKNFHFLLHIYVMNN